VNWAPGSSKIHLQAFEKATVYRSQGAYSTLGLLKILIISRRRFHANLF
jgi:hypothetical protein